MPEDVTPKGNVEGAKPTDVQEEVSKTNPTEQEKKESRYQSIEEAEKAKNSTDKELDKFTRFTKVLTQDDATSKIEALYEIEPDEVNRFYKRLYGKTYQEAKESVVQEEADNELKESNPEVYELKKELRELRKEITSSSKKTEKTLLDEFISSNPEIDRNELESEIANLNPNLDMKDKVNKAVSILAGQGKINQVKDNAYMDAYKKQSASIVSMGNEMRNSRIKKDSEMDAIKAKFNNPDTFSPGIKKLLINKK